METEKTLRERAAYARDKMEKFFHEKGYTPRDCVSVRSMLGNSEKLVYRALRLGYELGMDDAKEVLRKEYKL